MTKKTELQPRWAAEKHGRDEEHHYLGSHAASSGRELDLWYCRDLDDENPIDSFVAMSAKGMFEWCAVEKSMNSQVMAECERRALAAGLIRDPRIWRLENAVECQEEERDAHARRLKWSEKELRRLRAELRIAKSATKIDSDANPHSSD